MELAAYAAMDTVRDADTARLGHLLKTRRCVGTSTVDVVALSLGAGSLAISVGMTDRRGIDEQGERSAANWHSERRKNHRLRDRHI